MMLAMMWLCLAALPAAILLSVACCTKKKQPPKKVTSKSRTGGNKRKTAAPQSPPKKPAVRPIPPPPPPVKTQQPVKPCSVAPAPGKAVAPAPLADGVKAPPPIKKSPSVEDEKDRAGENDYPTLNESVKSFADPKATPAKKDTKRVASRMATRVDERTIQSNETPLASSTQAETPKGSRSEMQKIQKQSMRAEQEAPTQSIRVGEVISPTPARSAVKKVDGGEEPGKVPKSIVDNKKEPANATGPAPDFRP